MRRAAKLAVVLAAAGVVAGVPAAGLTQEIHPGEAQGLGLRGPEVPPLLKAVAVDPYRAPAAPACETIPAEILALDKLLGADSDQPRSQKSDLTAYATREAKGAVRGLIPYRGAIRFLTRADRKDHELMVAAQAGWARRGFLRGLEASLRCATPKLEVAANPAPQRLATDDVRRIQTAFASVQGAGSGAGEPESASTDIATVMLGEPPEPGSEKPGR